MKGEPWSCLPGLNLQRKKFRNAARRERIAKDHLKKRFETIWPGDWIDVFMETEEDAFGWDV